MHKLLNKDTGEITRSNRVKHLMTAVKEYILSLPLYTGNKNFLYGLISSLIDAVAFDALATRGVIDHIENEETAEIEPQQDNLFSAEQINFLDRGDISTESLQSLLSHLEHNEQVANNLACNYVISTSLFTQSKELIEKMKSAINKELANRKEWELS